MYFKRIILNYTHVSTYSHVGPYKKCIINMCPIEAGNYYLIRRHAHKLNWKHMYQISSFMHNIKTQVTLTPQMDQWTNIIAYHHVVLVKLKCVRKRFNIIICLFS